MSRTSIRLAQSSLSSPCFQHGHLANQADRSHHRHGDRSGAARQSVSCSPTLEEPELTPLRYLDPNTATPPAEEESAQDPWLREDPGAEDQDPETSRSSTDLKTHCAEDQREQADRAATSSTLAVVQAPCNTMTPVAPGLQLSSEANAIVASNRWSAGTST